MPVLEFNKHRITKKQEKHTEIIITFTKRTASKASKPVKEER